MRTTKLEDLLRHLDALELDRFSCIIVHSRLASFGNLEVAPASVLTAIKERMRSGSTLVAPAFTLGLAEDEPFSPESTPTRGVGVLAETIRSHADGRTMSPLHSHSYIGPSLHGLASWNAAGTPAIIHDVGPESDFDALVKAQAGLLLLGCSPSEGATICHHIEALHEVPYRQWLDLKRTLVVRGSARQLVVRYFGRKSPLVSSRFDLGWQLAGLTQGALSIADGPRTSQLLPLADVVEAISVQLDADPLFLIEKDSWID